MSPPAVVGYGHGCRNLILKILKLAPWPGFLGCRQAAGPLYALLILVCLYSTHYAWR
jgi:hypothetical protein